MVSVFADGMYPPKLLQGESAAKSGETMTRSGAYINASSEIDVTLVEAYNTNTQDPEESSNLSIFWGGDNANLNCLSTFQYTGPGEQQAEKGDKSCAVSGTNAASLYETATPFPVIEWCSDDEAPTIAMPHLASRPSSRGFQIEEERLPEVMQKMHNTVLDDAHFLHRSMAFSSHLSCLQVDGT